MTFLRCGECVIRERDLLGNTFEREYSCNEGNLTWKIINREVSEPGGLFGLISDNITIGQGTAWQITFAITRMSLYRGPL